MKRIYYLGIAIFCFLFISCSNSSSDSDDSNTYSFFSSDTEVDDGSMLSQDGSAKIFTNNPFYWEGETDEKNYAHGHGVIIFEEGSTRYIGNVDHGHINGFGKKYIYDNLVYEGDWEEGQYSGNGTLYNEGKIIYTGGFLEGEKSGPGTLYLSPTIYMTGEFSHNYLNGFGELYADNYCIRRGYFEDGKFKGESEFESLANKLGREVVREVFNGGTSINTDLYSVIYNRDQSEIEIVVDLSFNGDIITSNYYECRIAFRNYYPETEFLYKNETAESYLGAKTIINGIIGGVNIYNELSNN